jgi:hypothetical protein
MALLACHHTCSHGKLRRSRCTVAAIGLQSYVLELVETDLDIRLKPLPTGNSAGTLSTKQKRELIQPATMLTKPTCEFL